ncbi:MAG: L-carnitine dehydrogenase [Chloroflexi bacterium]|nr:L-carnitine dehydrogenase [Chloroflexota bacterium]
MVRLEPTQVQRVAVVGTGVIGGGWAAHFLRRGLEVVAHDPAPGAEARLRQLVADAWPVLEKLGLDSRADPARLSFAPDLRSAVAEVDFVQENAPENAAVKIDVLAQIDAAAPPSSVIASSTSGFAMTMMAERCQRPERCVVAHPFNPPYLIPLVEVVGGEKTDPAVIDWAVDFYTAVGKYAIKMERELPGFLANRLQEAVWREALHLVAEGLVSVEEIDAAMIYGPGLRWAFMGPCLTFHLAGGEGGMAHMLDHFGPALKEPWTWLEAPDLTPELRDRMVAGTGKLAAGRSIRELERQRDECLIALLRTLENCQARSPR